MPGSSSRQGNIHLNKTDAYNTNALHVLQIDADKEFNFVARAYLEPPTKVGPDGSELLMPYVLYVST